MVELEKVLEDRTAGKMVGAGFKKAGARKIGMLETFVGVEETNRPVADILTQLRNSYGKMDVVHNRTAKASKSEFTFQRQTPSLLNEDPANLPCVVG